MKSTSVQPLRVLSLRGPSASDAVSAFTAEVWDSGPGSRTLSGLIGLERLIHFRGFIHRSPNPVSIGPVLGALLPKGDPVAEFFFCESVHLANDGHGSPLRGRAAAADLGAEGGEFAAVVGEEGVVFAEVGFDEADGEEGWFGVGGVWVVSVVAEDGGDEAGLLVGVVGVVGFEGRGFVEAAGGGRGDLEADVVW